MAGPWGSAADDVEAKGAIYDRRLAARLLQFLKPYKKEITLSIVLLGIISLLEAAGPYLTKIAIDTYVKPASGHGGLGADATRGLLLIAGAYIGILAFGFVLRYVQSYTMAMVGQRAMQDLRLSILRHLEPLTPSYFDPRPVGRILTRVTQDVAVLNELFAQGVVAVIGDLFMLAAIVAAMFWLNWKLALVTMTTVILLVIATAIFRSKVRVSYRRVRTRLAKLNAFLQEHLQGLDVLKFFNTELKQTRKFDEANRSHYDAHVQNLFYYAVFFPVVEVIGAIALALILWYGGSGGPPGPGRAGGGGGVVDQARPSLPPAAGAATSGPSTGRICGGRSGWCSRTCSSSRARCARTSHSAPVTARVGTWTAPWPRWAARG